MSLSEAQRKAVNTLLDAGPGDFDGGMSTRKYGALTKVPPATASRDLTALAKLGLFVITGQGKSIRYWINIEGWGAAPELPRSRP
jgi:Fic family protein